MEEPLRLSGFGYRVLAIVSGAPVAAVSGFIAAYKHQSLHWEDFSAILLAPLTFWIVGFFRRELHTGWAMLLWPIILGVVFMYLYAAKVLALDIWYHASHLRSRIFLGLSLVTAAVLGGLVPPWYD